MKIIKGSGVSGGIAFGKLYIIDDNPSRVRRLHITDVQGEVLRFEEACKKAAKELDALYNKSLSLVGKENASIFEIHRMMLEDRDFYNSVCSYIRKQKLNAENAVAKTCDNLAEMFGTMENSYMQGRSADIRDISSRLISILTNTSDAQSQENNGGIVCAVDLSPSRTIQLDREKVFAFVTEKGSKSSHTAILARNLNIPAVILATGITDSANSNCDAIVDGYTGKIYISPDMNTTMELQKKKQELDARKRLLEKLKGTEPVTADGKKIKLYANISSPDDMADVHENDAMGVGLFRSEFIYMESDVLPTEDKQFAIYKSAAEKALGKELIIRTLDIGADKKTEYLDMDEEENPALGIRGIRLSLKNPGIFKAQLRAIYRASAYGRISIMFPMITTPEEVAEAKRICTEVQNELKKEGIPYNSDTPVGIMIETPAAALISDILAREVDFFSIGTNDLVQYTLCADRQNPGTEKLCSHGHPAILRLIKTVCDNAHKEGIWCGVCGELAGDSDMTGILLRLGVDELSVSPGMVLAVKEKILGTNAYSEKAGF